MKTEIKKLGSLSHNDTAATKLINDNFAALQQGIEDSLSRTGKTPNFMDKELDMNSKRIINTGDPVDETDAVNYGTYKKHIDQAVDAAHSAAISANNAQNSAVETRQYARQARTSRDEAEEIVKTGKEGLNGIVTVGKRDLENIINEGIVEISDTIDVGKGDLNQIISTGKQEIHTDINEGIIDISGLVENGKNELNSLIEEGRRESYTRSNLEFSYSTGPWEEDKTDFPYWYSLAIDVPDDSYSNIMVTFEEKDALSGMWSPVCTLKEITPDKFAQVIVYGREANQVARNVTVTFIK